MRKNGGRLDIQGRAGRVAGLLIFLLSGLLCAPVNAAKHKHYYVYKKPVKQTVDHYLLRRLSVGYEAAVGAGQVYFGFQVGVWAGMSAVAYNLATTPLSVPLSSRAILYSFSRFIKQPQTRRKLLNSVGGGRLHVVNSGATQFLKWGQVPFFAQKMSQRNLVVLERDTPIPENKQTFWTEIKDFNRARFVLHLWLGEERVPLPISMSIRELVTGKRIDRRRLNFWREMARRYLNEQGLWGRIAPHSDEIEITAQMIVNGKRTDFGTFNNGPGVLKFLSLTPLKRLRIDFLQENLKPYGATQIFDPKNPNLVDSLCQRLLSAPKVRP